MSRTGLWDSHAHLDDEAFNEDREQLIAQLEQDMDGIVNPGCDAASSAVAVELAEKYPFIYAAVGWHPENLKGIPADYLQQLEANFYQHTTRLPVAIYCASATTGNNQIAQLVARQMEQHHYPELQMTIRSYETRHNGIMAPAVRDGMRFFFPPVL